VIDTSYISCGYLIYRRNMEDAYKINVTSSWRDWDWFHIRSTNKKAITATSISARCLFMRDNTAVMETLFKYWDTLAWVIEVSAGLFISKLREEKRSFLVISRGHSFRERLFEQDLLTHLKVSWLFLFFLATLPLQTILFNRFFTSLS